MNNLAEAQKEMRMRMTNSSAATRAAKRREEEWRRPLSNFREPQPFTDPKPIRSFGEHDIATYMDIRDEALPPLADVVREHRAILREMKRAAQRGGY